MVRFDVSDEYTSSGIVKATAKLLGMILDDNCKNFDYEIYHNSHEILYRVNKKGKGVFPLYIKEYIVKLLVDMKNMIQEEEKLIEINSLTERLGDLNTEEVNDIENRINFQKLIQIRDFIPEFDVVLKELKITQYEIRNTKSNFLFYTMYSNEEFWHKLKELVNEDGFSVVPYEKLERIIICVGNCQLPIAIC